MSRLDDRQLDIIAMAADGMTFREIGEELGLATETIAGIAKQAYVLIGAKGIAHAIGICYNTGILIPRVRNED